MVELLTFITVASMVLVVYHHVGYPLILTIARRTKEQSPLPYTVSSHYQPSTRDNERPYISIVMPAYNEEAYIQDKIRNLAIMDYPADRFEIIIACDGCTDKTAELARAALNENICRHLCVDVREFTVNRGKIAVVNEVLSSLRSEFVALTDVSSLVSIDALAICVERFNDHTVGAVNGNYRLLNPGSSGEATYWRYQSQIKIGEEALGSVLGAHGAFYFLRTKAFKPLATDTINDDFVLPMQAIQQGYKVVYEPRLNALELEKSDPALEWRRRLRISAGNAQQLVRLAALLHPRYGGVALAFFSGKGLRVLMPFLMLISLVGSIALAFVVPIFIIPAAAQLFLYGLALWAHAHGLQESGKLAKTVHYLVAGHVAGLVGCLRYMFGSVAARW